MIKARRGSSANRQSSSLLDQPRYVALLRLVENLRARLGRINAYAKAADELFSETPWGIDRRSRQDFNRLSYYLGDIVDVVAETLEEYEVQLRAVMKRGRLDP